MTPETRRKLVPIACIAAGAAILLAIFLMTRDPQPGDKIMLQKTEYAWSELADFDRYHDVIGEEIEKVRKLDAAGKTGYDEARYLSVNFLTSHTKTIKEGATVQLIRWEVAPKRKVNVALVRVIDDAVTPRERELRGLYPFAHNDETGWMDSFGK